MEQIAERIDFTSREEWLKYRDGRLGGSSIATLFGLNKYETPYQLWEKMTGRVEPFTGNAATERGILLEPAIAAWVEQELGWVVDKNSIEDYVYQHLEHPFIIGSPDREAIDPEDTDDPKRIVEIKSTRMSINTDNVPDYWVCQVNHYMGLAGIHKGVIAWINASLEFNYIMVEFSQELFDAGLEVAVEFVMENVYSNIAPEVTNGEDAKRKYPVPVDGKTIEATDSVLELVAEVARLKKEAKEKDEALTEKEGQLKILMGDSESITYLGEKIATFKYTRGRVGFDAKTFKVDYPEIHEQYIKEGNGFRTLRIYNQ